MKSPLFHLGLLFSVSSSIASAAEEKTGTTPMTVPEMSGGLFMETFLGLLLVLGLIVALGWFMKRFGRLPTAGKGLINILGGVSLGPRERAVLIEVEGVKLVVGVAPGRVSALHVLNAEGSSQQVDEVFAEALGDQLQGASQ